MTYAHYREIAASLRELAADMIELGTTMDYYGGMGEMGKHGREMMGAGSIAASWADEIDLQVIPCRECNSTMAATQTEHGAFFVCGGCGAEIPSGPCGVLEE